ncbi:hypothetical protein OIY81_484 [Cryptosporidium canis]|uniref:Protein LTV1 homolog n=1 Tax=Cryptosporidium canis TaxID=195482 RepID=A0ABQ8PA79_9CRYT|nr:hypothetical protein OJ252_1838 [Cryptosporidium canis]KAJ1614447.1 hypothetical protein OIY81_484 [Cryptosporidium canis]
MGKIRKNKNVVKLRLLPSANEGSSSSPRWAPVSNREFTNDEKKGIRNILGNVLFHDELEEIYFDEGNHENNIPARGSQNDIDNDIFKDNYFPDDGYDYEQHLRSINKNPSYVNSNLNNKVNQDPVSSLLSSTSILQNSGIDINKDNFVAELVELTNCMEEPDEFEELNDDFIFDMAGLKDKYELDKNINIDSILWGDGSVQPSHKDNTGELDNILECSVQATLSPDNLSIFSGMDSSDEGCEDLLESILDEYNDDSISLEKHSGEPRSNKSNTKHNISEYEHILDSYINQARNIHSSENKQQKNYDDINIPFDQVHVEKIISILENTDIYDISSEFTQSEASEYEAVEQINMEDFRNSLEVINKPNKVNIKDYYLSNDTQSSANLQKHIKATDRGSIHFDKCQNYESLSSIVRFIPERKKDETSNERRNRKQAVKLAKREMRELKRKNKQDTKDLKKSIAGSFINTSQSDIKSGVRYFKF